MAKVTKKITVNVKTDEGYQPMAIKLSDIGAITELTDLTTSIALKNGTVFKVKETRSRVQHLIDAQLFKKRK